MRTLYRTKEEALKALKESGKAGYLSAADDRSNLDIDCDSFGGDGYMCFESWDDFNVWKNQK